MLLTEVHSFWLAVTVTFPLRWVLFMELGVKTRHSESTMVEVTPDEHPSHIVSQNSTWNSFSCHDQKIFTKLQHMLTIKSPCTTKWNKAQHHWCIITHDTAFKLKRMSSSWACVNLAMVNEGKTVKMRQNMQQKKGKDGSWRCHSQPEEQRNEEKWRERS